ncbi:hypothetical protein [Gulosibacter sediminis]|uniref:hypothetical protein n=1 Tax=Gulosibacter sediminis TaxID=1729695 RepID=UPI0024ADE0F0|nr:hypothetical protein [Gulosibacter sediminis]
MRRYEPLPRAASAQSPVFRSEPVHWASLEEFLAAGSHPDGIHVIGEGPAQQVEIMLGGDPFASGGATAIVIFSGAVTQRTEKIPPFFSGSGMAAVLGHPYVAVADTSLELSSSIGLAWYSGNSMFDQSDALRRLFTPLAEQKGEDLWLVGGSAGGFAALNLAHLLPRHPSVFTWNPQTDLIEYSREHVVEYATSAFPIPPHELAGDDYKQVLRAAFSYFGRRHTVLDDLPNQGPGRLVYLQNASDWHLTRHCIPYMNAHGYVQAGSSPRKWCSSGSFDLLMVRR